VTFLLLISIIPTAAARHLLHRHARPATHMSLDLLEWPLSEAGSGSSTFGAEAKRTSCSNLAQKRAF
jgi:hypothetical protein